MASKVTGGRFDGFSRQSCGLGRERGRAALALRLEIQKEIIEHASADGFSCFDCFGCRLIACHADSFISAAALVFVQLPLRFRLDTAGGNGSKSAVAIAIAMAAAAAQFGNEVLVAFASVFANILTASSRLRLLLLPCFHSFPAPTPCLLALLACSHSFPAPACRRLFLLLSSAKLALLYYVFFWSWHNRKIIRPRRFGALIALHSKLAAAGVGAG